MSATSAQTCQLVGLNRWWFWHLDVDDVSGLATLTCTLTDADPTDPANTPNRLAPFVNESGGVDVTLKNGSQQHVDFIANGWCNAGPVSQQIPVKRNQAGRDVFLTLQPFYSRGA